MLAFDTNLAPVVGQQITLDATNAGVVGPRIDLLIARAGAGECDLIVEGRRRRRGARLDAQRGAGSSSAIAPPSRRSSDAALRALAATAGQELTYTCVPPGSGQRVGIDRDEDGFLDRDELDAGRIRPIRRARRSLAR